MSSFVVDGVVGERVTKERMMDLDWLTQTVGKKAVQAGLAEGVTGGLNGEMVKFFVEFGDGSKQSFVIKNFPESKLAASKMAGHPRESIFYAGANRLFGESLQFRLPVVHYSYGNMETGEKVILFEDLSEFVNAGYYFGGGSPHNWGKDLEALTKCSVEEQSNTMLRITSLAFQGAVPIHAKYWRNREAMSEMSSWLRGCDWILGNGEESWSGMQQWAAGAWAKHSEARKVPESDAAKLNFNADLVAIVDSSLKQISWSDFQASLPNRHWTLVHGDFHPANMMWQPSNGDAASNLVVIDWEQVGVGSGPQELAQFLISHMSGADRRKCETELLKEYYASLTSSGVKADEYSYAQCYADYVQGGSERWVWMLCILAGMCPPKMVQYFHDQCWDFMFDHGVTALNVGMPRV